MRGTPNEPVFCKTSRRASGRYDAKFEATKRYGRVVLTTSSGFANGEMRKDLTKLWVLEVGGLNGIMPSATLNGGDALQTCEVATGSERLLEATCLETRDLYSRVECRYVSW